MDTTFLGLAVHQMELYLCNSCIGAYLAICVTIGGGKGGARGLKPPLRMISHRNYLSWSGAENRDKDRDTLIEQSL